MKNWNIKTMNLDFEKMNHKEVVAIYYKACQDGLTKQNKNFRMLVDYIKASSKNERISETTLKMGERLRA